MMKLLAVATTAMVLMGFGLQQNPKVFLIGDSTVRNSNEQYWGWGTLLSDFLDTSRISVENHAMAGRSTRTFRKRDGGIGSCR
jgi:lysophospholipase L1-like esterase